MPMSKNYNLGVRSEVKVSFSTPIELLGKQHNFFFDGREVSIGLPTKFKHHILPPDFKIDLTCDPRYNPEATATVTSYQEKTPVEIEIGVVNVFLGIIPDDGIVINDDIIGAPTQKDRISRFVKANGHPTLTIFADENYQPSTGERLGTIGLAALRHWCRIARWVSDSPGIGMISSQTLEENARQYYFERSSHLFLSSIGGHYGSSRVSSYISLESWSKIQDTLIGEQLPPIWIDFIHDAAQRIQSGDYRGGFLDSIIAAESYLGNKLMDTIDSTFRKEEIIISRVRKTNVSEILHNFRNISTLSEHPISNDDISILKRVFQIRNSIMHGRSTFVSSSDAMEAFRTANRLCSAG